jgi:hypothetical protein
MQALDNNDDGVPYVINFRATSAWLLEPMFSGCCILPLFWTSIDMTFYSYAVH